MEQGIFSPSVSIYSNIMGLSERVERSLASYLSPDLASYLKAQRLPTKPRKATTEQVYQADLLKDLDEGREVWLRSFSQRGPPLKRPDAARTDPSGMERYTPPYRTVPALPLCLQGPV